MPKKKAIKDPTAESAVDGWMIGLAVFIVVVTIVFVSMHIGSALSMVHQDVPVNPIEIVARLARGKLTWPRGATIVAVLMVMFMVGSWILYRKIGKWRAPKNVLPVDAKGDVMATGGQIESLTDAAVRRKATELGVRIGPNDPAGVPIGMHVSDGVMLYGSYEDLHLDIWGPRQGKSTSRVIPAILSAVGPVIATSNKRDVVDATRDVRERTDHPTFVFDPQHVAGEEPTWYWNPLAWVRGPSAEAGKGAEVRAARFAGHFADSDDGMDAKSDAFFDPEGEDLLAGLFLAAAVAERPIGQVWDWVTDQQNDEPVHILRGSGWNLAGSGLAAQYNAEQRTKSGIFGTAKKMARCLKLSEVHTWVSPNGGHEFDELEFIEGGGTLYCLSLEGRGSAGALVSALTEAVIDVAMTKAAKSAGGRLDVPLLAVLDEAANVVRWKDLPKQYSHFGSRGIVVMTVLQSWAQGVRCWGVDGMNALWAAANIRVIGSGVDDTNFLRERSEAIGDHDSISKSVSRSAGGKSYSSSMSSSRTFSVADLIALPRGRAIVFPSGGKAALIRTVPWWEGEYNEGVKQSIAQHDPGRKTQITDIRDEKLRLDKPSDTGYVQEVPSL